MGVARQDITPPVGIFARNWGAAKHDVAEGVHRPLTLIALTLQDDARKKPLVLIDTDLVLIFGDNNVGPCESKRLPHLTTTQSDAVDCSPHWEFRADRASHPVSAILSDGILAAISVQPYSDQNGGTFIRNGLFSQISHDGEICACGVTLGSGVLEIKWAEHEKFAGPQFHLSTKAETSGTIFLRPAASRPFWIASRRHTIPRRAFCGMSLANRRVIAPTGGEVTRG